METTKPNEERTSEEWTPLAKVYDPVRVATIDGSHSRPHDRAVIRAIHVCMSLSYNALFIELSTR